MNTYGIVRVGISKHPPAPRKRLGKRRLLPAVGAHDLCAQGSEGLCRVAVWVPGDGADGEGAGLVGEERTGYAGALVAGCAVDGYDLGGHFDELNREFGIGCWSVGF